MIKPELYAHKGFEINEIVNIYKKYCEELNDPEETWIEGYDEFLFYRSDIEIRKSELSQELKNTVIWCDEVVLKNAYNYLEVHEHGIGLLDDWYRNRYYPTSHWWWYVDKIHHGEMNKPNFKNSDYL